MAETAIRLPRHMLNKLTSKETIHYILLKEHVSIDIGPLTVENSANKNSTHTSCVHVIGVVHTYFDALKGQEYNQSVYPRNLNSNKAKPKTLVTLLILLDEKEPSQQLELANPHTALNPDSRKHCIALSGRKNYRLGQLTITNSGGDNPQAFVITNVEHTQLVGGETANSQVTILTIHPYN